MTTKMTASTNVQALKSRRGLTGLINKHLSSNVRDMLENVRPELVGLNQRYELWSERDLREWREGLENMVVEYNRKPSQLKNKSRRLDNIDEFVERSRAKSGVNGSFYGTEFMAVAKLGNQADWFELVERFDKRGISEAELLESLNEGFKKHGEWFNEEFNKDGLAVTQVFTNLDEVGAPHSHLHIVSTKVNEKTGLPIVNLGAILGARYGDTQNRYSMRKFRNEVDEKLVDCCSEAIKELAKSRGLEFGGLEMVRLEAEQVGLAHERYVEEQIIKSKIGERLENVSERERKLDARENAIYEKEYELNEKEKFLSEQERSLDSRDMQADLRETNLNARAVSLRSQASILEGIEKRLKDRERTLDERVQRNIEELENLPIFDEVTTTKEVDMAMFMKGFNISVNGEKINMFEHYKNTQKAKKQSADNTKKELRTASDIIRDSDRRARLRDLELLSESTGRLDKIINRPGKKSDFDLEF